MHQSAFELIHTEDQPEFRRNLHWALDSPHAPEGEPSPEGKGRLASSPGMLAAQLPATMCTHVAQAMASSQCCGFPPVSVAVLCKLLQCPVLGTSSPHWGESWLDPLSVPLFRSGEESWLFCCHLQARSAAPRELLLPGEELCVPLSLPPG